MSFILLLLIKVCFRCLGKWNVGTFRSLLLFGNHDNEQGKTRAELYDLIRGVAGNLLPDRGASPSPDYILTVKSSADASKDAALLYCMDSHSYSSLKDVDGYAWLTFGQVSWYRAQSAAYTARNGGKPYPALAFFHIPLPSIMKLLPTRMPFFVVPVWKKACAPQLNTGMFAAMKEAGDVMGVFVGHDHDNDYAVMWKNILFSLRPFYRWGIRSTIIYPMVLVLLYL